MCETDMLRLTSIPSIRKVLNLKSVKFALVSKYNEHI